MMEEVERKSSVESSETKTSDSSVSTNQLSPSKTSGRSSIKSTTSSLPNSDVIELNTGGTEDVILLSLTVSYF